MSGIIRNVRNYSTKTIQNASMAISPQFVNRNPRNLERLRIGYKPDGYHLERPGRNYWHKLKLSVSGRYVTATIDHFENGEVLKASTKEWTIKRQLYRCKDVCAFTNLGRVMADRCLKSGLIEVSCNIEAPRPDGRIANFLKAMQEGGVCLTEPSQFKPDRPWDLLRKEKPWEITEPN